MKRFLILALLFLSPTAHGQRSVLVWEELADRHATKVGDYIRSRVRSGENVVVDKPYLAVSCTEDLSGGADVFNSTLDDSTSEAARSTSAVIDRGDFSRRLQTLYEDEFDRLGRESMDPAASKLLSRIRSDYLGKGTIDWLLLTRLSCDGHVLSSGVRARGRRTIDRLGSGWRKESGLIGV